MADIATPSGTIAPPRRRAKRPGALPSWHLILVCQIALLIVLFVIWHLLVKSNTLPKFIFGQPYLVVEQLWEWMITGEIVSHLWTTLLETILAFGIGTALGMVAGLWLGLNVLPAAILDPYVKALNAMPRVILGPIFIVWFGLGIWSKVALGVTLVFCVVFFNVFQGVREVSPIVLANARMLGASRRHLLKSVYIPSAMSWVFSSLHTSVGLAFVGAVVGEYLGAARGMGYLILQAESVFNINAVFAGIIVLTTFALILDYAVTLIERRLLGWRKT